MYMDFNHISEAVRFRDLFDRFGVVYYDQGSELRGNFNDGVEFIVNKEKNLFFCPKDREAKGSVINFLSCHMECSLLEAARAIHKVFLKPVTPLEREIPKLNLHYCKGLADMGITEDTCRHFGIGLVREKSVMAGKLVCEVRDIEGNKTGYIGWTKDAGWYFPKGHKNIHVYNADKAKNENVLLVADAFEVAKKHQEGIEAISLLSSNMTEEQEDIIAKQYHFVTVDLPNYANIVVRLAMHVFVTVL